ncbi:alpha/beta fold hydrolase [Phytohabitans sp. ZYX-F-186]|uniref:Alpha/beta fold hydrolase n=1 Tax=Phytohabitans maris TaxID=3071409 RepID=A0ABU0ZLE8_9ACTN|nr:alpha/beta fold hydrolase [Phytohabitans sp. ZYX-F-186]MDQ7907874.1 alpha/beta fold hydrolase [Phytohabitans sp. ZYX-F-186]
MTTPSVVYERRGAGEPLVLLHGIGHHWQAWLPVLDRLAEAHDVIAVDLPGFGASPMPTGGPPRDMARAVEGVATFLGDLGLDRPHVAGNSLGGAMALELACAGRVASATALSPAGFWTRRELRWAIGALTAHRLGTRVPEPVMRAMFRHGAFRSLCFGMICARPGRLTPEVALSDALALRDGRAFRAVARAGRAYAFHGAPTVPVTVAWGTRDRILPYRQATRARAALPGARHVDLPGCGHVPMSDDPDLVASVILATTGPAMSRIPDGLRPPGEGDQNGSHQHRGEPDG